MEGMEAILNNLLIAENVQKATEELNEALKQPGTIQLLCGVATSSKNPQLRQYASVILRKKLVKLRNWNMVPADQQEAIKNGLLQAIINEPEKSVRASISQVVGALCNHEFPKKNQWSNDLLKFIFESAQSADPRISQLGSETFASLCEAAPDQFVPHLQTIGIFSSQAMVNAEQTNNFQNPVMFNLIMAMSHLVRFILGNNAAEHIYSSSVPYVVKTLVAIQNDTDKFIDAFDILENLADQTPKLLTNHVTLLIEFCLELSRNKELDDAVRVKVITFIGWLVRIKKKIVLKQKLVEPIIATLFELMSLPSDDSGDDTDEYFGSNEITTPMNCATQTMDVLALNIPPKNLIPPLLQLLEPALQSSMDPLKKKAAYLSIAVIAEGCSSAICKKYLRPLLDCIKTGITDQNPVIRNSALFALGQFAEHLQPEISQYSEEILPILFDYLQLLSNQIRAGQKEPQHIDRVFYAVETFCENLEDALVPHLIVLMQRLFDCMAPSNSVHLRELALSSISAVANATKSNMLPYFPQLIEILKMYLVKTEDEDICTLRPAAIDTLAALARTIGKENFLPLAVDTMNLGLNLIEDKNDPDLKRSCYNLFAAMASVLNEQIGSALEKIVTSMIDSVKSTESILLSNGKDGEEVIDDETNNDGDQEFDIENSDGEDENDDSDEILGIENAYMDEKEEAVIALKELAEHTGSAFAPFIQVSFEEIYKLLNYPNEDIRQSSVEALCQFVISLFKLNNNDAVKHTLLIFIPKLSEIIHADEERVVVMAALDSINQILEVLGATTFEIEGHKDAIFSCIFDVLHGKVQCQFDEPEEDDEDESEYDTAILESAGEILPKFGKAMSSQEFYAYFGRVSSYFAAKIQKSKSKDELAQSQRAMAVGVISECFEPLGEYSSQYFDSILPLFIDLLNDENDDEVRNNSVYAIGELVVYSGQTSYKAYPQILAALSAMVQKETHGGVLDNVCGTLARLIISNSSLVPIKDVLPVFISYLPLRQDYVENENVFKSLELLYRQGNEILLQFLERVILTALTVLHKNQYAKDEVREQIFAFVRQVRQDFPEKFNNAINVDAEISNFVQSL